VYPWQAVAATPGNAAVPASLVSMSPQGPAHPPAPLKLIRVQSVSLLHARYRASWEGRSRSAKDPMMLGGTVGRDLRRTRWCLAERLIAIGR
jgi:hypothetical protein